MAEVNILEDRKYTDEHEWVKVDGELAVVGITDYASTQLGDITYVEVKGKGDIALAELFRRWVDNYDASTSKRVCLMLHMPWTLSRFVGWIVRFFEKLTEAGSSLSIWVEHRSCYKNIETLGITSFIPASTVFDEAVRALRHADARADVGPTASPEKGTAAKAERREVDQSRDRQMRPGGGGRARPIELEDFERGLGGGPPEKP